MQYSVTHCIYACDDGVAELVTRHFDDFVDAVEHWAALSQIEDYCVISQVEPDELDVPF